MAYEYVELAQEITIRRIYTVHYFEYMNDFYYAGESHDFWEFLFVDKGAICVTAGDEHLNLKKDEIVFHKPNEFHNLWANGQIAPRPTAATNGLAAPPNRGSGCPRGCACPPCAPRRPLPDIPAGDRTRVQRGHSTLPLCLLPVLLRP